MTKQIPLTQGKFAIVDDEDFERVNQFKWAAQRTPSDEKYWVAFRSIGTGGRRNKKTVRVLMHRFILDAPKGKIVDHINGNPLDNRRSNMRLCTARESRCNTRVSRRNQSGYKGVHCCRPKPFYYAAIYINGKNKHFGHFRTPEEAARVYDEKAKEYFGEFAWLNFPEKQVGT